MGARGGSNGRSWLAGLAEVHRASLWILSSNKNERRKVFHLLIGTLVENLLVVVSLLVALFGWKAIIGFPVYSPSALIQR